MARGHGAWMMLRGTKEPHVGSQRVVDVFLKKTTRKACHPWPRTPADQAMDGHDLEESVAKLGQ